MFLIWMGSLDDLMFFLEALKNRNYNLKFTMTFHQQIISFLDIQIYVN